MLLFIGLPHFIFFYNEVSIHLMLLFIFLPEFLLWSCLLSFNTSHVTLYLYQSFCLGELWTFFVSIHLMLLFIVFSLLKILHIKQFQYISCYSLSISVILPEEMDKRFNTSHVTLYLLTLTKWIYAAKVSIHLMLLFISVPIAYLRKVIKFQYISCYSLSTLSNL